MENEISVYDSKYHRYQLKRQVDRPLNAIRSNQVTKKSEYFKTSALERSQTSMNVGRREGLENKTNQNTMSTVRPQGIRKKKKKTVMDSRLSALNIEKNVVPENVGR